MNVAFRVDVSADIGTGHLMRCLALADVLRNRGAHTIFVSRHMLTTLKDLLTQRGHGFIQLIQEQTFDATDELPHAQWLGTSQIEDARQTVAALSDRHWDLLVIDHYSLDHRWECVLKPVVDRICVIDDLADRRHDCDVLLDQNLYADMATRYADKVPPHCRLLLGPRYALLREEFSAARSQAVIRNGTVKRLLVFFGGVDRENHTAVALAAIEKAGIVDLHVDVVIGMQHPFRAEIEATCKKGEYQCHVQTSRMAELMVAADMSIGAGGGATWERCCLGLPTFALCTANNQRRQIDDAARDGLLYSPSIDILDVATIADHLRAFVQNPALREFISRHGLYTVDGSGMRRVAGCLGVSGIELRPAVVSDSENLFAWRNHSSIRNVSRDSEPIVWADHQRWLASVLISPVRDLLIGFCESSAVGVVRFDISGTVAEISIYVVPDVAQPGLGSELLRNAEAWLVKNRPGVNAIRAHVLGGNLRSERLFLGAGYQVDSTSYLKRF